MKNVFFVVRPKGNTIVSIMYNRMDGKYHFVNIKSNHICVCGFNSVESAIDDMERLKQIGKITDYFGVDI